MAVDNAARVFDESRREGNIVTSFSGGARSFPNIFPLKVREEEDENSSYKLIVKHGKAFPRSNSWNSQCRCRDMEAGDV